MPAEVRRFSFLNFFYNSVYFLIMLAWGDIIDISRCSALPRNGRYTTFHTNKLLGSWLSKNFSFWIVSLDLDAMFRIKPLLYKDLILNSRGCRKSNELLETSPMSSRIAFQGNLFRKVSFQTGLISEKLTCLRMFSTIFLTTGKFSAALSFRTRQ